MGGVFTFWNFWLIWLFLAFVVFLLSGSIVLFFLCEERKKEYTYTWPYSKQQRVILRRRHPAPTRHPAASCGPLQTTWLMHTLSPVCVLCVLLICVYCCVSCVFFLIYLTTTMHWLTSDDTLACLASGGVEHPPLRQQYIEASMTGLLWYVSLCEHLPRQSITSVTDCDDSYNGHDNGQ